MVKRVYCHWSEEELRGALQRLVDAAYGRRTTRAPGAAFHVPVKPDDADVQLSDAISELFERREQRLPLEATATVLKRLARHYGGRARVAQRLMNQTADVEEAARYATVAVAWDLRKQTILTVARNLEIPLEDLEAEADSVAIGGTIPPGTIGICSDDGPDKELVFVTGEVSAPQSPASEISVHLMLDGHKLMPSAASKLGESIDHLPAAVKTWLREIGWPYDQAPHLTFEQNVSRLVSIGPGEPLWYPDWKSNAPITASVHNGGYGLHLSARFRVVPDGTWIRVPSGESAS